MTAQAPRVGLFVTCLVDLVRPSVGFAAVKLLEDAGCRVEAPEGQTCCGQPAYNSGDRRDAVAIARQVIAAFGDFDYVVVPSGSCGGMIAKHYPELFAAGTPERAAAEALAAKTHELVSFLVNVMKVEKVAAQFAARATYHDSCSGLRELGIKQERKLLATVDGVTLRNGRCRSLWLAAPSASNPAISDKMLEKKLKNIAATGAGHADRHDRLLMNMAGQRQAPPSGAPCGRGSGRRHADPPLSRIWRPPRRSSRHVARRWPTSICNMP
jgi:L-lactate dehydrogenase complex protein LldE